MPILMVLLGLLFWGMILGGGGYLLLRAVRALEQRARGGSGALAERVRVLEDALLRMEGQVEELAEAQRFTTRLLTERTGGANAPPTPPSPDGPGAPDGPGTPKPDAAP